MAEHFKAPEKKRGKWWKVILWVVGIVILIAAAYVAYVFLSYSRIEDNTKLDVIRKATADEALVETEYTAVSYNVGFGAYTPDFTFFMDGGKSSWAESKESVNRCITGAADTIKARNADFIFLQEVDDDSTRTYHIDETEMFENYFSTDSAVFSRNFHSSFLAYPILQPHGIGNSGLLTLSCVDITSSVRRSLPISESFSKVFDLDRCYSVSRVPVENGKELILIDVHLSAYGTDGDLQSAQLDMLFGTMKEEYEKGNYVICGGDYNHDFIGNSKDIFNSQYEERTWAASFPDDKIPSGFRKLDDYDGGVVTPSCRDCDIPYSDESFTVIVDGFIVSDNISSDYVKVLDTGFEYSDHNPVVMKFSLNK